MNRCLSWIAIGALVLSCANKQQMSLLQSTEGDRYFEAGDYEQAIAAYSQAAALFPKSPLPHISLGRVYVRRAEYGKATAALRSALTADPANGEAHERPI